MNSLLALQTPVVVHPLVRITENKGGIVTMIADGYASLDDKLFAKLIGDVFGGECQSFPVEDSHLKRFVFDRVTGGDIAGPDEIVRTVKIRLDQIGAQVDLLCVPIRY